MDLTKGNIWEKLDHEWIHTALAIIAFFVLKWLLTSLIKRNATRLDFSRPRRKLANRLVSTVLFITCVVYIAIVWGVDRQELVLVMGSFMAVLGVAFFAQWSILSNITGSLILFFSHPLKLADTLEIIDKEAPIRGKVVDITAFFIHIQQTNGELVAIPNNVFLSKAIKLIREDTPPVATETTPPAPSPQK